ncbi:MAG: DUF5010 C-terminal domain-containing protein [Prevotellaceae bacterium]|jgi:hypothetical protein|nr:DUF5010 C-terminal domain-containing protein [Prevotellaceae bacterium]
MKNIQIFLFTVAIIMFVACNKTGGEPEPPETVHYEQAKSPKRGVSYSFAGFPDEDMALLSPAATWFYNWGIDLNANIDHSADFYDIAYVPMAWNGVNENALRKWVAANPDCKYILAFNEPNLTDQANMTPSQAADRWGQLANIAKELNLKIVSPAMNYGTLANYSDPIKWLDEFFAMINPDDIYAIAIHCYMGSAGAMKSYVERFKKYGKPIWMTEFCAWENTASSTAQMQFMSEAIIYMELDSAIERYAWFIPKWDRTGVEETPYMQLITKTYPPELTERGKVFTAMSACDKYYYALAGKQIEAEHFTNCNLSQWTNRTGFARSVHFRPTTDQSGGLDIYNFTNEIWVEYQAELTQDATYNIELRNIAALDTDLNIYIDGKIAEFASLAQTQTWTTSVFPVQISKGRHIIRLEVTDGNCALNWIKIDF